MFGGTREEASLTLKEKARLFLTAHWRGTVCVVTPILFLFIILPTPVKPHQWCAYTLVIMAIYWVSECIPLAITSFLPLVIFPMTDVMTTTETCLCYINDTVFMFIGSLMLAYAVEQSGLHKRIALCAIQLIGYSHYKLLFAMCFTTMFVSMWITNTAATTMMVPIIFALLRTFENLKLMNIYETNSNGERVATDLTACYFCAATYSATIGGIGTLVGTATNLVFKGLFTKSYPTAPEYLSFPSFSAFSVPYMLVMNSLMYLYLLVVYMGFMRPKSEAARKCKISESGANAAKAAVKEDYEKLGKITFWEIMVILLFSSAMILFFLRAPQVIKGWADLLESVFGITDKKHIKDSAVAMGVSFLMLLLPSTLIFCKHSRAKFQEELPNKRIPSVLHWAKMNNVMPYSFMFLLGGGFALSTAARKEYTDLNGVIGTYMVQLKNMPNAALLLIIIIVSIFLTNFASNVAVCNVITPIAMQMAKEIGYNPLWYNIATGFTCSYAFMLPVGTPGNLIVQSAANIPTKKMIIAGAGPTLSTVIVTWLAMYFWAPVIWPDLKTLPDWIQ